MNDGLDQQLFSTCFQSLAGKHEKTKITQGYHYDVVKELDLDGSRPGKSAPNFYGIDFGKAQHSELQPIQSTTSNSHPSITKMHMSSAGGYLITKTEEKTWGVQEKEWEAQTAFRGSCLILYYKSLPRSVHTHARCLQTLFCSK